MAVKAPVNTDAIISDRAYAPWSSHNIHLIQYGCHMGKKVYLQCKFKCTINHTCEATGATPYLFW